MWVNLAVTGINHQPFIIRIINQDFQQFFPDTLVTPANKAAVGITPTPVVRRQIPPWGSCSYNPENSIDKLTIICGYPSPCPFSAW